MLSNVTIQKFLDSKDIIITPWHANMMAGSNISLFLGEKILIPDSETIVDIKKNILPKYKTIKLSQENPFPLKSKMFVLGETLEAIGLSERIGMLIEGRSTFARLGISIEQSSTIVDTGQKPKKMTLEIYNSGPNTILLYPKMKFCKACFFLLDPPATIRYDINGKYQSGDSFAPIFNKELKT